MGDENITPAESLTDSAFKPRDVKRPFCNPNYHDNTLAANLSKAFNCSQSQDNSVVSICSFKRKPQNVLRERISNVNHPNFDIDQSCNGTFSQSINEFPQPSKSRFNFNAPTDLTFAVSSSEPASGESSRVLNETRSPQPQRFKFDVPAELTFGVSSSEYASEESSRLSSISAPTFNDSSTSVEENSVTICDETGNQTSSSSVVTEDVEPSRPETSNISGLEVSKVETSHSMKLGDQDDSITSKVLGNESQLLLDSEVQEHSQVSEPEDVIDLLKPEGNISEYKMQEQTSAHDNTSGLNNLPDSTGSDSEIEKSVQSEGVAIHDDSLGPVSNLDSGNLSRFMQSESNIDSLLESTRKQNYTYTIVQSSNFEALTEVTCETGEEKKLLNSIELDQSKNSTFRNQASQNSATKNDTFEVRRNGTTILETIEEMSPLRDAASVTSFGIGIGKNTIRVQNSETTNVTDTEHAELVEIENVTDSEITPVTHPLVGHSYCMPSEITGVSDLKEGSELITKISEVIVENINMEEHASQESERKSFLSKRKSSRLQRRKSDREETTLGFKATETLTDSAFKPRDVKHPFNNPNYHENTLAADLSKAFKSSQSQDISVVSISDFKRRSQHALKQRISNGHRLNFDVDQSTNETLSQPMNEYPIPPKPRFNFDVPTDLTFAASSSEPVSEISSRILSETCSPARFKFDVPAEVTFSASSSELTFDESSRLSNSALVEENSVTISDESRNQGSSSSMMIEDVEPSRPETNNSYCLEVSLAETSHSLKHEDSDNSISATGLKNKSQLQLDVEVQEQSHVPESEKAIKLSLPGSIIPECNMQRNNHVSANTSDSENLSNSEESHEKIEKSVRSEELGTKDDSLGPVSDFDSGNLSRFMRSESNIDSLLQSTRKQNHTYTIVHELNYETVSDITRQTNEEKTLTNPDELEQSQNGTLTNPTVLEQSQNCTLTNPTELEQSQNCTLTNPTEVEQSQNCTLTKPTEPEKLQNSTLTNSTELPQWRVSATKSGTPEEKENGQQSPGSVENEPSFRDAVSVTYSGIDIGESPTGADSMKDTSIEMEIVSRPVMEPVVHPLVGHSYCMHLEIDSVFDGEEKSGTNAKINEIIGDDISAQARKSSLPIRKSTRLLKKSIDSGEMSSERTVRKNRKSSMKTVPGENVVGEQQQLEDGNHTQTEQNCQSQEKQTSLSELKSVRLSNRQCTLAEELETCGHESTTPSANVGSAENCDCSKLEQEQQAPPSKRKSGRLSNRESTRAKVSLVEERISTSAVDNASPNAPTHHMDIEQNQWESGIDMLDDIAETEATPLQNIRTEDEKSPFLPNGTIQLSKKSIRNVTIPENETFSIVSRPIIPAMETPVLVRKSVRLLKRKSPDTETNPSDDNEGEVVSCAPEPNESAKNVGTRKSARLSTKAGYSVRFVDTVHSISTIEGAGTSCVSPSERSFVPRKSSTSSCARNSASQTGSSQSSEPSLVNKLFPKNDDSIFVQPTSVAPKSRKKAKRSAQLLPDLVDEEVAAVPKKPHFPRLADYIHERFYEIIIEKMRPKYGIETNAKAVQLAKYIHEKVEEISCSSDLYPEEEVKEMAIVLARKQIVKTHYEFWFFCWKRLPHYFMRKAFPLHVIKNGKRQLRDCSNVFDPIIPDAEDEN